MEAEEPTTEMDAVESGYDGRDLTPEQRAAGYADPQPAAPSILDELVARRDEMASEDHELVLDVPGYKVRGVNRLAVRYRYPETGAKGLAAMERRAIESGSDDAIVSMQIDYLVQCCDEVLGRDDAGNLVGLDPEPNAPPLKFGKRLAELFKIEIPEEEKAKARFVCRRVFSPGFPQTGKWEGDIVMTDQSRAVQAWLTRIHEQANEDFSGE